MVKVFNQIKENWRTNLIVGLISLVIGLVVFFLYYFLNNQTLLAAVNGVTISTFSLIGIGLLCWLAHLGAFDTFSFGFKQLGSMLFAKEPRKEGPFHEYKQAKKEKREKSSYYFIIIILVGFLFAFALAVLEIIFHSIVY